LKIVTRENMFTAGCTITVWVECILRWCQEISGAVVLYNYGVGVQYLSSFQQSKSDGKLRVIQGGAKGADD
jgi:hypothetical protein